MELKSAHHFPASMPKEVARTTMAYRPQAHPHPAALEEIVAWRPAPLTWSAGPPGAGPIQRHLKVLTACRPIPQRWSAGPQWRHGRGPPQSIGTSHPRAPRRGQCSGGLPPVSPPRHVPARANTNLQLTSPRPVESTLDTSCFPAPPPPHLSLYVCVSYLSHPTPPMGVCVCVAPPTSFSPSVTWPTVSVLPWL